MCFFIDENNPFMLTAKKDITVYKVIGSDNCSFYQFFQYVPNTLYRLRKRFSLTNQLIGNVVSIHKGFHSYIDMDTVNSEERYSDEVIIAEFTIPKGAKYYINEKFGEIVSTSIRSGNLIAIKIKDQHAT